MNIYSIKPATANLLFDSRRQLKDKTCPVKLVIYYNGAKKRYDTKISLLPQDWEKVSKSTPRTEILKEKKAALDTLRLKAEKVIEALSDDFSFEMFESLYFEKDIKKKGENKDVYKGFEKYIEQLKEEKRIGTSILYADAMKSLKRYSSNLEFKDVTVKFLERYEKYMLEGGKSVSTIGIYLRHLRAIVNMAKADKIITAEQYPFGLKAHRKYEIPSGKNIKKALDESDILKIIDYIPITDEEARARDLWLFSLYCNGMNMADIFNLKYDNIQDEFIYFHRQKTIRTRKNQEPIEIFISEPVAQILQRWGNKNRLAKNYIFDVYTNKMSVEELNHIKMLELRKINAYMKRIAKRLGITAKVSTYAARHSWATLLLRRDVSIGFISKGLGHTSFATTEKYLGSFTQDKKREVAQLFCDLQDKACK